MSKIHYKRVLAPALYLLTAILPAIAQNSSASNPYSQVSIASPTAASLGKYADIPVNNHTGIPQIGLPIYTIKEGSLALPISLSYHAGGIKVLEPASWVGTGWALNAGGVITRTVMGTPDEKGTATNAQYGHFSDYGFFNYWTVEGNYGPGYPGYNGSAPALQNDNAFATGKYDGEPDLFFFNFNGYTGKFYFSDDRTPMLVDGQDLKIEYYYPGGTGVNANIQGFIITVPTGDKYYFGITNRAEQNAAGPKPVERSSLYLLNYGSTNDNVYSSYFLRKIVAADGVHTIDFAYESERYSYYSLSMYPVVGGAYRSGDPADQREYALVNNNVDGVRLKKISFSTGSIEFNPASAARSDLGEYGYQLEDVANTVAKPLGNVTISGTGLCKQFSFDYDYFVDNSNTALAPGMQAPAGIVSDKSRLKLNKVTERSCDGSLAANPWVFEYRKDVNGNYFLPRRLSFAQDHWGFYNGADGNSSYSCNTLIATYKGGASNVPFGTEYAGANRDAAWPQMAYGSLTSITYPTGGSANFEMEPNTVWVNYSKYDTQYPYTPAVSPAWSTNFWNNYTFTANNYYRFKLYYTRSNCTSSNPPSAQFSDNNSVYLSASPQYPYSTKTVLSTGGQRRITLDINTDCRNDQAQLSIEEAILRNVQENAFAGGLRIKKQTAKDGASAPDVVTSYSYLDEVGHSSGTLYSRPRYVQAIRNKEIQVYGYTSWTGPQQHPESEGCLGVSYDPNGVQQGQTYLKSPGGIMPMSTTQGNHIGYDRVKVSRTGGGSTVYTYYEYDNDSNTRGKILDDVCYRNLLGGCDPSTPYLPAVPLRYEFRRGLLKNESVYNEANQVLKSTQYNYAYDSSRIVTPCKVNKMEGGIAPIGTYYELRAYRMVRADITETAYFGGPAASVKKQVRYYDSPFHKEVSKEIETTPTGEVLETRNQYALDFRVPTCDNIADGVATYQSACAACDAQYNPANCTYSDYNCRRTAYWDNRLCRAAARRDYITYRRNKFTNSTNDFQTAHDNAKGNADSQLKPLLQLQDDFHNYLVESSQWRNGKLLKGTYTAFGPGLNGTAPMYPASQSVLLPTSPASSFTTAAVNGNGVSLDGRYTSTPEMTLKFDKSNLREKQSVGASPVTYLWDYRSTLPVAEVVNASVAQTAFTSFESDGPSFVNNAFQSAGPYGFDFDPRPGSSTHLQNGGGVCGRASYLLDGGWGVGRGSLPPGEYDVTFWAKGGWSNVYLFVDNNSQLLGQYDEYIGLQDYHLLRGRIRVNGGSVSQPTGGINIDAYGRLVQIDDVRICPVGAQMKTYTYDPLLGVTSSSDAASQPVYYEYDALGRFKLTRDTKNNIRQQQQYHYRP